MKSRFSRVGACLILLSLGAGEAVAQGAASAGAGGMPAARPRSAGVAAAPSDAEIAAQRRSAELQLKRREEAAKRTLGSICTGC